MSTPRSNRELFELATDEANPYAERVAAQDELSRRAYAGDAEASQALSPEGLPAARATTLTGAAAGIVFVSAEEDARLLRKWGVDDDTDTALPLDDADAHLLTDIN